MMRSVLHQQRPCRFSSALWRNFQHNNVQTRSNQRSEILGGMTAESVSASGHAVYPLQIVCQGCGRLEVMSAATKKDIYWQHPHAGHATQRRTKCLLCQRADSGLGMTVKQLTVIKEHLVVGIDPDNHGAVAVVRISQGCVPLLEALQNASPDIYDMPLEKVVKGKRVRNQADSEAVVRIVQGILQPESQAELYAILEEPIPNPTNGLLSVLGTGYAYGIWKGVLASHAIRVESTSARRWKGDLGLNKLGKEGSRALALTLFPKARDLLKRKKDHGRAEALLIVAWALGVRAPKISTTFAHVAEGEAIALPADAEGELVVTEGRVPISSSYELEVTEPFSEGLAVT